MLKDDPAEVPVVVVRGARETSGLRRRPNEPYDVDVSETSFLASVVRALLCGSQQYNLDSGSSEATAPTKPSADPEEKPRKVSARPLKKPPELLDSIITRSQ